MGDNGNDGTGGGEGCISVDLWAPSSLVETAVAFLHAVDFERACTCWLVMTMLPASAAVRLLVCYICWPSSRSSSFPSQHHFCVSLEMECHRAFQTALASLRRDRRDCRARWCGTGVDTWIVRAEGKVALSSGHPRCSPPSTTFGTLRTRMVVVSARRARLCLSDSVLVYVAASLCVALCSRGRRPTRYAANVRSVPTSSV